MLVICEECATKYNVDENRIKGARASFNCKKCSHQIVVRKPVKMKRAPAAEESEAVTQKMTAASPGTSPARGANSSPARSASAASKPAPRPEMPADEVESAAQQSAPPIKKKSRFSGMSVGVHFLFSLIIGFSAVTGAMGYLYFVYIPNRLNQEIDLSALYSPVSLIMIGSVILFGIGAFLLLAQFITKPLRELTAIVHRISLGELDLVIEPKGPREIQELAKACDRMRYSIKEAIKRLKTR